MPKTQLKLVIAALSFMLLASCARVAEEAHTPAGWRARVSTLAGSGAPGYADGAARETRFADPFGVAVGKDGSVYVAEVSWTIAVSQGLASPGAHTLQKFARVTPEGP